MQSFSTDQIRNVALLSHHGAGKTSLSEAMLFTSGSISRMGKVDEGTTTSDHDPEEIKKRISINLSPLYCPWKNKKINLLDTPGYADFIGGVVAGGRIADGAIIVVCAASGVEVGTEQVWGYVQEGTIPRIIFINKMDRENADFYKVVEQLQKKFGRNCVPVQLPIGAHASFEGLVDLIDMKASSKGKEVGIPTELESHVKSFREKLVEAVAESDDALMARYLDGEEITSEEIKGILVENVRYGKITPILTGSALHNIGMTHLLDAVCSYLPSPEEARKIEAINLSTNQSETVEAKEDYPLVAFVYMTNADAYVGRLTHFRVYSGFIESNSQFWNPNKEHIERVGQLFVLRGKVQEPVSRLIAGDIGAVAKLAVTGTGDTLCNKEHPLKLAQMEFPRPVFNVALYPKAKADVDKLGAALPKLLEEDPSLQVHKDADTGELILSGMGDAHIEVTVDKMHRKFGVEVISEVPKIAYRETITSRVQSEYKHKKQSGGHGQYGHVVLELEPLSRGEGFEFVPKVVGGAVPKNYIPAVEKGVLESRHEGVLAKYPVEDVRVTLVDGSAHPVDSSEIAFKIAASQALKKGLADGHPVLIEPVMLLDIAVPEIFIGDVIGDLNTKRAKVHGMNIENGLQIIQAHAPLSEVVRYAIDLRSLTQGRGAYSMKFSHYENVPAHITEKIVSEQRVAKA